MAQVVAQLLKDLHVTEIQDGNAGKLVWLPSPKQRFPNEELLSCSEGRQAGFPWKSLWKVRALLRVAFFSSRVALGRVLTTNNQRKRGIIIMKWRFMCKSHGEDVNHLKFSLFCGLGDVVYDI